MAIGFITAERVPETMPITCASRIVENIDRASTDLFAIQSYRPTPNWHQRKEMEAMGFDVITLTDDFPELAPGKYIPVCLMMMMMLLLSVVIIAFPKNRQ